MSAYEAGRHYGIKGSMTVYRWVDQQEKILGSTFAHTNSTMDKKQEVCPAELTAEVEALKKLLSLERLRSESYLMMIKLAEEKYGLPIEKKSGTKQSK
jgi:transposase-like protein